MHKDPPSWGKYQMLHAAFVDPGLGVTGFRALGLDLWFKLLFGFVFGLGGNDSHSCLGPSKF